MTRFNLWVTDKHGSKVICYGSQGDMNDLALSPEARLTALGTVHVLPDHEEPDGSCLSPSQGSPQPVSASEGEHRP